jgi:hypothetical protein
MFFPSITHLQITHLDISSTLITFSNFAIPAESCILFKLCRTA